MRGRRRRHATAHGSHPGVIEDDDARPRSQELATPRLWKCYVAFGLAVGVVYAALPLPATKLIAWPLLAWSSVVAILVGVKRNRPEVRGPWFLLAAGVAMFAAGDNLFSFRAYVLHSEAVFPSYVDLVYLAVYPLTIAGLAWMVRVRSDGRDRASLIDAWIITTSVGLIAWVFLIDPYVRSSDGVLERLTSIAYPLGDVALLAIAVRLAVGSGRRPAAFWLLGGSIVPLIAADALYGYMNLAGTWHEHNPVDAGWIVFYVGWGAAALHPSMARFAVAEPRRRPINPRRLLFVGGATLIPPAALYVEHLLGRVVNGDTIGVASAVAFVLVLVRVSGMSREVADARSETRFRTLIDNASDATLVVGIGGIVKYHTPSAERVLGGDARTLDGRPLAERLEDGDADQLQLLLTGNTTSTTVEWRVQDGHNEWRDLEVIAADIRGVDGVDGLVLTMRDITDRKQLDAELRRQALHDSLTSLPNRALFLDHVGHALSRGMRGGSSVGVLFLDLDDFKLSNDRLGHAGGDELLITVGGARLTTLIRPGDTVARFGGDEFALLVEDADVGSKIEEVANRVEEALQEPLSVGVDHVLVRVSIGMAVGTSETHNPDDLLRDADAAMYVAKRNGKARHVLFDPAMHEEAQQRVALAGELRDAIGRDELVVLYQPIVDVHTQRMRGAEALVRWQHPQRGLLGPSEFIPIAETNGVIIPLGRWVLEQACTRVQQWKHEGLVDESFYVTVNLSARHIQDRLVVDHVVDALKKSQLPPATLVLELTETALLEDLERTRLTLDTLKGLGIRLAIDDFGTGYSSLSYLSAFPLDVIKIDKSFVDQVTLTSGGEAMVRAVVELGRALGLQAVAEGIEHADQAVALERLGCDLAQGYLFAKPMPADEMATALAAECVPAG